MATQQAATEWAYEKFGPWAWFMKDPSLGHIIVDSANNYETIDRLEARIMGTEWFRTRSASMRKYDDTEKTDPQEHKRQLERQRTMVEDVALNMGVSGIDYHEWARNVMRLDLTEAELRNMMASQLDISSVYRTGQANVVYTQAKQIAHDYMMPLSHEEAFGLAQKVAAGDLTEDALQSHLRQRARGVWSHLSDEIDQGITVRQYFAGHQAEIARTLEMSPDQIDMADPEWSAVTRHMDKNYKQEESVTKGGWKGATRALDINETLKYVRSTDRWGHTTNAKALGAKMAQSIAETMGKKAS